VVENSLASNPAWNFAFANRLVAVLLQFGIKCGSSRNKVERVVWVIFPKNDLTV